MQQVVQRPHAPGRLDLHPWPGRRPHELEVRRRGPLVAVHAIVAPHEAVPGARLDEADAQVGTNLAQLADVLVLQVVVFENDLEHGAPRRDDAVDGVDLVLDVVPLAAEGLADVDDHVDLGGARVERLDRLGHLGRRRRAAVREAHRRAYLDGGAGEHLGGERHRARLHAGACHPVLFAEEEARGDLGVGEGGVEEGVVDVGGEHGQGDFDFYGLGHFSARLVSLASFLRLELSMMLMACLEASWGLGGVSCANYYVCILGRPRRSQCLELAQYSLLGMSLLLVAVPNCRKDLPCSHAEISVQCLASLACVGRGADFPKGKHRATYTAVVEPVTKLEGAEYLLFIGVVVRFFFWGHLFLFVCMQLF